ncbi:MAG: prepilin-type N-terminal cleavage/methylation domain-containing protein [Syntrophorhabdales bacterium]|jgi:prepilin-type N-terminal cleavage/methylation domain-containing protein
MGGKHSKLQYEHDHFRELTKGFSLVELMVALAIAGFLGMGLWALMNSQNKTYQVQDTASQMQQNLRAAIDRISRDLLSSGQGPTAWQMTINGQSTNTWYVPATPLTRSYSSAGGPNQLDLIECDPMTPATLKTSAASGASQIVLNAGQGASFPVNSYLDIGDAWAGYESAQVKGVAGDTLTIDTNPGGTTHTLQGAYIAGTNVRPLRWITYKVNTNTNQLTRDAHDGTVPTPVVANNIQGLTVAPLATATAPANLPPDGGLVQITLTGSAVNGVASTVADIIHLRNP